MSATLQDVLKWPLPEVMAWFDGISIHETFEDKSFNWVLFAEYAGDRAREQRSLSWARMALRVHGVLAEYSSGSVAANITGSAMRLRARMIELLGAREDDPVLDFEVVFTWFQSFAFLPHGEVLELLTSDLSALPAETIDPLMKLKSALRVLSRIPKTAWVRRHPELKDWLQLRRRFP